MKILKILPPTPIMLISLSYISYFFSDLQTYSFIYKPHPHSPLPQQTQLSNFTSLTTVRQALESINIGLLPLLLVVLVLFYFFYLN